MIEFISKYKSSRSPILLLIDFDPFEGLRKFKKGLYVEFIAGKEDNKPSRAAVGPCNMQFSSIEFTSFVLYDRSAI